MHSDIIEFKSYNQLKKIKKPYILLVEDIWICPVDLIKRSELEKIRFVDPKNNLFIYDLCKRVCDDDPEEYDDDPEDCCFFSNDVNYSSNISRMQNYDIGSKREYKYVYKPKYIIIL